MLYYLTISFVLNSVVILAVQYLAGLCLKLWVERIEREMRSSLIKSKLFFTNIKIVQEKRFSFFIEISFLGLEKLWKPSCKDVPDVTFSKTVSLKDLISKDWRIDYISTVNTIITKASLEGTYSPAEIVHSCLTANFGGHIYL